MTPSCAVPANLDRLFSSCAAESNQNSLNQQRPTTPSPVSVLLMVLVVCCSFGSPLVVPLRLKGSNGFSAMPRKSGQISTRKKA